MPEAVQVRAMFSRIAARYDLLNRLLSLGIDRRWRNVVVDRAAAVQSGKESQSGTLGGRRVVDACCGTGDLALAFADAGATVLGLDFTPEMVRIAEDKLRARPAAPAGAPAHGGLARGGLARGVFVHGDALSIPARSGSVDVASVAFGIRNVADRGRGLAELRRVLRPGGTVLVLEFSMPRGRLFGALYRFYFTRVLPRIGGLISGDAGAYRYLPETVGAWPAPEEFERELEGAGLVDCGHRPLSGGIACLHWGSAPAERT